MCGSGMGKEPSSTLGEERKNNPYLRTGLTREAFTRQLLSDVPPTPSYYRRMKRVNADGPALLRSLPGQAAFNATEFRQRRGWGRD
jgi:hydroxyacylglutathione hydrolase